MILGGSTVGSQANSIFVSGSDVYAAGGEFNTQGFVAEYWKNGVVVTLAVGGNTDTSALSVFVDGKDVYVAGVDPGRGYVLEKWRTGCLNRRDKRRGEDGPVVVSGTDVYVAGWEYKTTRIDPSHTYTAPVAEYWKNGVVTELSDPLAFGIAHSIFLSGTDILRGRQHMPRT